jgi:hypothetical protein
MNSKLKKSIKKFQDIFSEKKYPTRTGSPRQLIFFITKIKVR